MFNTGDKLNNGATVMAAKPKDDYFIVLAQWNDAYCRFVTWAVDKRGDAYWGHYFPKQEDAMKNFLSR